MSTTPASNTENFAEGQAPSSVNDGVRDLEAALRGFYEDIEWRDLGHTPTRTGNTTFTIAADVTATYITGRRIRCTDASTIYGTIVTSAYSAPNTTVTIAEATGNLSASLTNVSLGYIPSNHPVPVRGLYLPNLNLGLPPDLVIIRPTAATIDIDWSIGGMFLENSSNVVYVETGNLTVDITASAANGLDTGAEAADTWYYVYCIYNPATNVLAGLLSLSATAPTLPSGSTYSRLIGAVRNDGSSDLIDFRQIGKRMFYMARQEAYNNYNAAATYESKSLSSFVPPSRAPIAYVSTLQTGTGASNLVVSIDGTNDYATTSVNSGTNASSGAPVIEVPVVSQAVYFKETTATASQWDVFVNGFELAL